jgi:hypothetical protein
MPLYSGIVTPPGVKHWHVATASSSVTHLTIQEMVDGKNVTWLEHVTDVPYTQQATPTAPTSTRWRKITSTPPERWPRVRGTAKGCPGSSRHIRLSFCERTGRTARDPLN